MAESKPKKQQIIAELNQETSKIAWSEMQKFFASGSCIYVDSSQDLLDVASELVLDNKPFIESLMSSQKMHPVSDEQATRWLSDDAMLWAVVLAPYVLIQLADDKNG